MKVCEINVFEEKQIDFSTKTLAKSVKLSDVSPLFAEINFSEKSKFAKNVYSQKRGIWFFADSNFLFAFNDEFLRAAARRSNGGAVAAPTQSAAKIDAFAVISAIALSENENWIAFSTENGGVRRAEMRERVDFRAVSVGDNSVEKIEIGNNGVVWTLSTQKRLFRSEGETREIAEKVSDFCVCETFVATIESEFLKIYNENGSLENGEIAFPSPSARSQLIFCNEKFVVAAIENEFSADILAFEIASKIWFRHCEALFFGGELGRGKSLFVREHSILIIYFCGFGGVRLLGLDPLAFLDVAEEALPLVDNFAGGEGAVRGLAPVRGWLLDPSETERPEVFEGNEFPPQSHLCFLANGATLLFRPLKVFKAPFALSNGFKGLLRPNDSNMIIPTLNIECEGAAPTFFGKPSDANAFAGLFGRGATTQISAPIFQGIRPAFLGRKDETVALAERPRSPPKSEETEIGISLFNAPPSAKGKVSVSPISPQKVTKAKKGVFERAAPSDEPSDHKLLFPAATDASGAFPLGCTIPQQSVDGLLSKERSAFFGSATVLRSSLFALNAGEPRAVAASVDAAPRGGIEEIAEQSAEREGRGEDGGWGFLARPGGFAFCGGEVPNLEFPSPTASNNQFFKEEFGGRTLRLAIEALSAPRATTETAFARFARSVIASQKQFFAETNRFAQTFLRVLGLWKAALARPRKVSREAKQRAAPKPFLNSARFVASLRAQPRSAGEAPFARATPSARLSAALIAPLPASAAEHRFGLLADIAFCLDEIAENARAVAARAETRDAAEHFLLDLSDIKAERAIGESRAEVRMAALARRLKAETVRPPIAVLDERPKQRIVSPPKTAPPIAETEAPRSALDVLSTKKTALFQKSFAGATAFAAEPRPSPPAEFAAKAAPSALFDLSQTIRLADARPATVERAESEARPANPFAAASAAERRSPKKNVSPAKECALDSPTNANPSIARLGKSFFAARKIDTAEREAIDNSKIGASKPFALASPPKTAAASAISTVIELNPVFAVDAEAARLASPNMGSIHNFHNEQTGTNDDIRRAANVDTYNAIEARQRGLQTQSLFPSSDAYLPNISPASSLQTEAIKQQLKGESVAAVGSSIESNFFASRAQPPFKVDASLGEAKPTDSNFSFSPRVAANPSAAQPTFGAPSHFSKQCASKALNVSGFGNVSKANFLEKPINNSVFPTL